MILLHALKNYKIKRIKNHAVKKKLKVEHGKFTFCLLFQKTFNPIFQSFFKKKKASLTEKSFPSFFI